MENKIKYLEMIQNVITRMAGNSFALKSWTITLVAGVFVLAGKDTNKFYFLIIYVTIIAFWALDTYYLLQERLYRSLYEKSTQIDEKQIDFSLSATRREFGGKKNNYCWCLLSPIEIGYYLPLILVCTFIIIVTNI